MNMTVKRKVLWLCNFPTIDISLQCNLKSYYNEGWNKSLCDELISQGYEIVYIFTQSERRELIKGEVNGLFFYGIYKGHKDNYSRDSYIKNTLRKILMKEKPEIVHIMGTEFVHSLEMIEIAEEECFLSNTIVSIQGIIEACAKHYSTGVPYNIYKKKRLKDVLYKTSVYDLKKEFARRGENEHKIFQKCENIIGRTEFDRAYVYEINPQLHYYTIGEVLRPCFYEGDTWDVSNIERNSIFISQATYPLKGFHIFLEAATIIKNKYPDFKVYIAGNDIYAGPLWKKSAYEYYIRKMIENNKLIDNIVFLGNMTASEMKRYYLKCNVFVSPSTLENSSNSIGEAMILGTPIISSNVGGVCSLITHKKEGILYQVDAPYMLAYYIDMIFSDDDLSIQLSKNAICRSKGLYNKSMILSKIIALYNSLYKNN